MSSPNNRKSQPLFSEEGEPAKEKIQLEDDASKLRATNELNPVVSSFLRGEDGLELPEELQKEEDILNAVTYNTLLEKGIERNSNGGSTLVSQALQYLSRLELLDGHPTEMSSKLKERIESARQLVDRVMSICGIASLPPDILILIFSLAIDASRQDVPRSLHSVRMSHVCRHFRDVITTTPLFWTEISSIPHAPRMELVEACLQRSGSSPLDVHLNVYIFPIQIGAFPVPQEFQQMFPNVLELLDLIEGINCDPTLSSLARHAHRWRTLHLNIVPINDQIDPSFGFELIQNTFLPILESITVYRESADLIHLGQFAVDKEYSREMGFASSWTTPMLRTLNLRNIVPSSLPESSLANITTIHISLSTFRDVASLYPHFSKLKQVEEVFLDVSGLGATRHMDQLERLQDVVLGSARSVTLRFSQNIDRIDSDMELLQAIFFKLYCPNATSLAVEAARCKREPKRTFLYHLLPRIPERFPKVRYYTIAVTDYSGFIWHNDQPPTSLPLHFPPDLEHLTFACDSSLCFSFDEAQKTVPRIPMLSTLTLGVNPLKCYKPALKWVRWIVDYIQSQNHQEQTFANLEYFEYSRARGYKLTKVVPCDEIDAWCKSDEVHDEESESEVEESENEELDWSDE